MPVSNSNRSNYKLRSRSIKQSGPGKFQSLQHIQESRGVWVRPIPFVALFDDRGAAKPSQSEKIAKVAPKKSLNPRKSHSLGRVFNRLPLE